MKYLLADVTQLHLGELVYNLELILDLSLTITLNQVQEFILSLLLMIWPL